MEHKNEHCILGDTETNPEWSTNRNSQLLDEITNKNISIQRELEILSQEIGAQRTDNKNTYSKTIEHTTPEIEQRNSALVPVVDNSFQMSNLLTGQWKYLNTSQPSIRSEFQSYNLLTVSNNELNL